MNETNNRVTDITVCGAVVLCPYVKLLRMMLNSECPL